MKRTSHLTNVNTPMPPDYEDMMRHYLPDASKALIVDAWKHNATPLEVMRHIDRIEAKLREKNHVRITAHGFHQRIPAKKGKPTANDAS